MTRRHVTFPCEGETLAATLDEAPARVGLLIVTGGNETRAGAHCGQARLAAAIAGRGYPVFRFDRRGVGDSTGQNGGFRASEADVAAALAAFRREVPALARVVAYGNCDAASALLLQGGAGCAALALANPWTFEGNDGALPPAAIRQRYAARLKDPRQWLRLATGGVSLRKLAGGLKRAVWPAPAPSGLLDLMQQGHAAFAGSCTFLLAGRDRTARAFMARWPQSLGHWQVCEKAGHTFAEPEASEWLVSRLCAVLQEQAGQLDMG